MGSDSGGSCIYTYEAAEPRDRIRSTNNASSLSSPGLQQCLHYKQEKKGRKKQRNIVILTTLKKATHGARLVYKWSHDFGDPKFLSYLKSTPPRSPGTPQARDPLWLVQELRNHRLGRPNSARVCRHHEPTEV